jgi:hypothetical protein
VDDLHSPHGHSAQYTPKQFAYEFRQLKLELANEPREWAKKYLTFLPQNRHEHWSRFLDFCEENGLERDQACWKSFVGDGAQAYSPQLQDKLETQTEDEISTQTTPLADLQLQAELGPQSEDELSIQTMPVSDLQLQAELELQIREGSLACIQKMNLGKGSTKTSTRAQTTSATENVPESEYLANTPIHAAQEAPATSNGRDNKSFGKRKKRSSDPEGDYCSKQPVKKLKSSTEDEYVSHDTDDLPSFTKLVSEAGMKLPKAVLTQMDERANVVGKSGFIGLNRF